MSGKEPQRLWIHGITGRMGHILQKEIKAHPELELVGGSGKGFVGEWRNGELVATEKSVTALLQQTTTVLDFSSTEGTQVLLEWYGEMKNTPPRLLLAVTGLAPKMQERWQSLAKQKNFALLEAPNTSIGVFLMLQSALQIAKVLAPLGYDIEIMETHHRFKMDAPSGTAKLLADTLAKQLGWQTTYGRTKERQKKEIGIASLRGGNVFGEHSIHFLGDFEEIVITHKAFSRELFAKGALRLALWLETKKEGCFKVNDLEIDQLNG